MVPQVASAAATADLSVSQVATPLDGGGLTIAVTVSNGGPSAAGRVRLTEFFAGSGGVTLAGHTSTKPVKCVVRSAPAGWSIARVCTVTQLRAAASFTLTWTLRAPTATNVTARATAKGATTDPTQSNNVSTISSRSGPVADVGVSIVSVSGSTIQVGIYNNGPNSANAVLAHVAGGAFVGPVGCPPLSDPTHCAVPALLPGDQITVVVQGGSDTTISAADGVAFDPDTSNNTAGVP